MTGTRLTRILTPALALAVALALPSAAGAQAMSADGTHNATHLGGATAFYTPPLRSAASLKQMAARPGMVDDIRKVLTDAGIPETVSGVLATLKDATSSVAGGSCDAATPADGTLVACDFQPGSTMLWMAYRPDIRKGSRTPGRIDRFRWAGAKPFKALLFRVTNDHKIYTFVLPMACGNLSLMSVTEIPGEPISVSVDPVCDPKTGILRATVTAAGKDLARVKRVNVAIDGRSAGQLTAQSWTLTSDRHGEYTFDAVDANDRAYSVSRRTIRVEACPAPKMAVAPRVVGPTCSVVLSAVPVKGAYQINVDATGSKTGAAGVAPAVTVVVKHELTSGAGQTVTLDSSLIGKVTVQRRGTYRATATVSTPQGVAAGPDRYEGSATCEASIAVDEAVSAAAGGPAIFFDILGGKDRRVRPIEDTDLEFAQCSPLIGLKLGVAKRLRNDWEVAGTVGVGISLASGDDKVRESALFVDVEVNKYLRGGAFVGTGLSFWDLTRGDTFTPAWLLHFGVPLTRQARPRVYFVGEGRLFFDHIDDASSNYLLWAGVRVNLGR